jgi:hypothetical protein
VEPPKVRYWEIIADKLRARDVSWGCSLEINATGRALYTADAYRKDGNVARKVFGTGTDELHA